MNFDSPIMIGSFKKIKIQGMACGKSHSLAWDVGGAIFSWGSSSYNKLGIPRIGKAARKFL